MPDLQPADESAFEISITPGVWLPRLGGEIELGSTSAARAIDFEDELDLNDLEPTFKGELTFRSAPADDGWSVMVSGFSFDTQSSGRFEAGTPRDFGSLTLHPNDPYDASFEFESFSGEFGFMAIPLVNSQDRRHGPNEPAFHEPTTILRLTPHVGARYIHVRQKITRTGAMPSSESESAQWLAGFGGATVTLQFDPPPNIPLIERVKLSGTYALGPALQGGNGFIWQVRGEIGLQFTPNASLVLGYRLVEMDLDDDDFEIDGGLQGMFFAGRLMF